MSDLEEMFKDLESCCLHNPLWRPDDVQRVIKWHGDRQTGPDSSSIVIVRLKTPPIFGLLVQSEDYTGHGCQCNSATSRRHTLASLLTRLEEYELAEILES